MILAPRSLVPVLTACCLVLAAIAGCGQSSMGLPAPREAGLVEAQADLPDIAAQIAKATVSVDARGTRVKHLPVPGRSKAVTFLTYKAFDNNLAQMLPEHLNVLERVGSNAQLNALALVDGDGPKDTAAYYLRQDGDEKKVTSPYVPMGKGGELDTGSPDALRQAVKWAAASYPAGFRWVDVNDHGGGYYGICQDDQTGSVIRLPQLAPALGAAGKIDLLTFDACLMATAEVAYELRGTARVMVASEDESNELGMNYDRTLATLQGSGAPDAGALARALVLGANRKGAKVDLYTVSAIDLSKADAVRLAVDRLATALLMALPRQRPAIKLALAAVKPFSVAGPEHADLDHRDLHETVEQLAAHVAEPAVQAACQGVRDALFNRDGAIMMSRAVRDEHKVPRGLSIYLPTTGVVDPIYLATAFAKDTHWSQFLAALK